MRKGRKNGKEGNSQAEDVKSKEVKKPLHKIWDPKLNRVIDADEERESFGVFGDFTHVHTEAGEKKGMFRYYVILPLEKRKTGVEKISHVETIAKTISCLEFEHLAELESLEVFPTYLFGTILISPDVAVIEFIELLIDMSREVGIPLRAEHFVSNLHRPTESEISDFIKRLK